MGGVIHLIRESGLVVASPTRVLRDSILCLPGGTGITGDQVRIMISPRRMPMHASENRIFGPFCQVLVGASFIPYWSQSRLYPVPEALEI